MRGQKQEEQKKKLAEIRDGDLPFPRKTEKNENSHKFISSSLRRFHLQQCRWWITLFICLVLRVELDHNRNIVTFNALWTDYIIPISRDLPFCAWRKGSVQTAGQAHSRLKWDVSFAAILFEVKRTLVDGKVRPLAMCYMYRYKRNRSSFASTPATGVAGFFPLSYPPAPATGDEGSAKGVFYRR